LAELNWAGFYFLRGEELVLGPFQGQPACVRIPLGQGRSVAPRRRNAASVLVPDVHAFPGHIACDGRSRSELVVPLLIKDGLNQRRADQRWPTEARVLGVLDLDSPRPWRFDAGGTRPAAKPLPPSWSATWQPHWPPSAKLDRAAKLTGLRPPC